mmetsp:Transcript_57929/g.96072  ORF Transcript_57929/g.96072 Transcript_57929/m.96072 type:complete len:214 (+) Transcript_57929:104-745(+)
MSWPKSIQKPNKSMHYWLVLTTTIISRCILFHRPSNKAASRTQQIMAVKQPPIAMIRSPKPSPLPPRPLKSSITMLPRYSLPHQYLHHHRLHNLSISCAHCHHWMPSHSDPFFDSRTLSHFATKRKVIVDRVAKKKKKTKIKTMSTLRLKKALTTTTKQSHLTAHRKARMAFPPNCMARLHIVFATALICDRNLANKSRMKNDCCPCWVHHPI